MENVRRYRDEVDGRLCEDRIIETPLSDGSGRMQVKERWAQKVPMAIRERVSSRIVEVPVEVKTQIMDENGNIVGENIEVVPSSHFSLVNEDSAISLKDIKEEIRSLASRINTLDQEPFVSEVCDKPKVCCQSKSTPIVAAMDSKYQSGAKCLDSSTDTMYSWIIWIGVALAAAVLLHQVM